MGWEVVKQCSDTFPRCLCGSLGSFSHEMFELGEDLLDGVQVWAVGRQEQEPRADAADCCTDGRPLVTGEVVHDHDVARRERGHEELLDIIEEALAVDGLIQHAGGIDPVATQGGKEGHRLPVTIGHFGVEPLALGCPATQRGHIGLGPGLIDEDEAAGIKPPLIFLPLPAPPCDLGPKLFGGQYAFF